MCGLKTSRSVSGRANTAEKSKEKQRTAKASIVKGGDVLVTETAVGEQPSSVLQFGSCGLCIFGKRNHVTPKFENITRNSR